MGELRVSSLTVEVDGRATISGASFDLKNKKSYGLIGQNGAGKSTLLSAIIGQENYQITNGKITLNSQNITDLHISERAKKIGIIHQKSPKVSGVPLKKLFHVINQNANDAHINQIAKELKIEHLLHRDANDNFSGGEMRRAELAQVIIQNPQIVLIDELDSGVDIESMALITAALKKHILPSKTTLIVSHSFALFESIQPDAIFVMNQGEISKPLASHEAVKIVKEKGYEAAYE